MVASGIDDDGLQMAGSGIPVLPVDPACPSMARSEGAAPEPTATGASPVSSAAAISSAGDDLMVSSAGSLARGSNRKLPSCQESALSTTSSPSPSGAVAWNRCPKRKKSEQLSAPSSTVSVPVARSDCMVCSSEARSDSCNEP